MATKQITIDFLLQQIQGAGTVYARKMFGEYGVYCNDKIVALVCDDELFVKPTNAGLQWLGNPREKCPYPGAKPYFHIPRADWEDKKGLTHLIQISAAELPLPKKKSR